jgi:hypothetical protein
MHKRNVGFILETNTMTGTSRHGHEHEIPCREVIEAKVAIDAACKKVDLVTKHQEEALRLARKEMERRLKGMNEFRDQLEKQAHLFAVKSEETLKHTIIEDRIRAVERKLDVRLGAVKWSDHIITVLIGIAVVYAVWVLKGN